MEDGWWTVRCRIEAQVGASRGKTRPEAEHDPAIRLAGVLGRNLDARDGLRGLRDIQRSDERLTTVGEGATQSTAGEEDEGALREIVVEVLVDLDDEEGVLPEALRRPAFVCPDGMNNGPAQVLNRR